MDPPNHRFLSLPTSRHTMMNFLPQYYGPVEGPLGFPLSDRQARALDQLLKTMPKDDAFRYRKLSLDKGPTELSPGERSDVSWISTQDPDRLGDVVIARGMNDTQFRLNPIVTLNHAYWAPPVGKSLWRKFVKDGHLKGIKAKTQYPPQPRDWKASNDWPPDTAFALVQAGLLSGKSIGLLPVKVHSPTNDEIKKNDWEGKGVTLVIDEWLLLEYACCYLMVKSKIYASNPIPGAIPAPPTRPARPAWGIALPRPARTRPNAAWAWQTAFPAAFPAGATANARLRCWGAWGWGRGVAGCIPERGGYRHKGKIV